MDTVRAAHRSGRNTLPAASVDQDVRSTQAEPDDADARSGNEPVDWIDPSRHLQDRQFLYALARCLDAMPELAALIFALRALDGLSNEQAALEMGLEPRRASVLMHRTLARLRDGLGWPCLR